MSDVKQTILVTGASGFLGQHVVKLLQEKDPRVKEIRCLDLKPYENKLGKWGFLLSSPFPFFSISVDFICTFVQAALISTRQCAFTCK